MLKYMNRPVASTRVLITGPETTVGSILSLEARSGSSAPSAFAHRTIVQIASAIVTASAGEDPHSKPAHTPPPPYPRQGSGQRAAHATRRAAHH